MKKLFLTMVAMMSMTLTFAENENMNSVNNAEAYNLSVNMNQLSKALNLANDQVEAVAEIHKTFCSELMFATQYGKEERDARVDAAVKKDLGFMNYVLNHDQYKKYVMLLNVTMNNRGLK
ncbi:hypothetical protein [Prevotella sp. tf2-5]|jgi:poly(A) polymerase Pap1|uniref:hypothetical protein n=1 Tax=Prevotella sp. tf2-5 TaxID=1761889 RepID=UPI0008E4A7E4|nr:hypothetical protein [Prevotella sp. tf2-5]SFO90913.1 hypothetical protein SAMN04487852_110106 [Prevotella sp. tf2-5]